MQAKKSSTSPAKFEFSDSRARGAQAQRRPTCTSCRGAPFRPAAGRGEAPATPRLRPACRRAPSRPPHHFCLEGGDDGAGQKTAATSPQAPPSLATARGAPRGWQVMGLSAHGAVAAKACTTFFATFWFRLRRLLSPGPHRWQKAQFMP
mmetsp:Transcript_27115/g.36931  ORF Transcript_27115/g.36931 Transcript_27115/m.36931 type:complete len:149 (+) Transcript_27115:279-725(+)